MGNVHHDIRNMQEALKDGDDSVLNHVAEVKDSRGYTKEFRGPRREVNILLTGYSVPLRAKFIIVGDNWKPRWPNRSQP